MIRTFYGPDQAPDWQAMAQTFPRTAKGPEQPPGRNRDMRTGMTGPEMSGAERHRCSTALPDREHDTTKDADKSIDLDRVVWDPEYRIAVRHLFRPAK